MEDRDIVRLYFDRQEAAIVKTQEKYHPYLMKIAMNILADPPDSEESVQDTYLAAWNSIPPHEPAELRLYLAKLTRRIAISRYRQKNAARRQAGQYALSLSEMENIMSETDSPEQELENQLLCELLKRFLRSLKADERRTFIGRYYFLDPLKDVAAYCGMSESRAKTLLFRTRQKLKEYLIKEGFTP